MKQNHYDLVILGSGSTAFAAALRAQELGKTSVMTEERTTGGTCVNRGCPPSKNLIEATKLIHDAHKPRYPGLKPAEIGLDFRKLIEQKDDIIHDYRKKKYESLTGDSSRSKKVTLSLLMTTRSSLIASGSRACARL
jgi:mercuric reductase